MRVSTSPAGSDACLSVTAVSVPRLAHPEGLSDLEPKEVVEGGAEGGASRTSQLLTVVGLSRMHIRLQLSLAEAQRTPLRREGPGPLSQAVGLLGSRLPSCPVHPLAWS